ncbi:hypothetical protein CALCODRAFT_478862 [Calocera cornea HHB12733]|uniref:Fms interacting protein n=1 Tax=Calocera cornea HHB12733 TaxID=1353952 RepID=A0A165KCU3_9BASI|nr:hypothetical protein CALCODRAFT_478862 [Calocera cornea HHB12733]
MSSIDFELDPAFSRLKELVDPTLSAEALSTLELAQIFAHVKHLNRLANAASRERKRRTNDARHEMDMTHLGLQNLMYEKTHLLNEIEKCMNFASIYQDIPLYSEEEFVSLAPEEVRAPEILADDHQRMLARLNFELSERQRLHAHKEKLKRQTADLQQESKAFSNSLNALRQQLDAMAKSSAEIQKRMHELSAPPAPAVVVSDADMTAAPQDSESKDQSQSVEPSRPPTPPPEDTAMDVDAAAP